MNGHGISHIQHLTFIYKYMSVCMRGECVLVCVLMGACACIIGGEIYKLVDR